MDIPALSYTFRHVLTLCCMAIMVQHACELKGSRRASPGRLANRLGQRNLAVASVTLFGLGCAWWLWRVAARRQGETHDGTSVPDPARRGFEPPGCPSSYRHDASEETVHGRTDRFPARVSVRTFLPPFL